MSQKVLLIPSAKLIPLELQTEFGAVPSAMIPIASRPALHYIAGPYQEQGYDIVVAVHEHADQIVQYAQYAKELNISTINVGSTQSLAETILKALDSIKSSAKQLTNLYRRE